MEAAAARLKAHPWVPALLPVVILAAAIGLFVALDAPGLDRVGVPQEELAVERTVLRPGEIELHLRNDGADPVRIEQAVVNDGFAAFDQSDEEIGRLRSSDVTIRYPWIEGQAYEVMLITATGATIDHAIDAATESPDAGTGFYGLMALIGLYVGVIPVAIGMLWLPWVRTMSAHWMRFVLAFTVGLLGFLGIDALLEGTELAGQGAEALGGAALVWLGAVAAYLALAGVDGWLSRRQEHTAFLVALGIGLHNLGEGLAIGSAYAIGSLALGAALVVGFALHNTTEGLAIVAPVARSGSVRARTLVLLGLLAGAPAILGAWIGASFFNPSGAAFMLGIGAGAIAQVIVQIWRQMRRDGERGLSPNVAGGLLLGLFVMYATGLLVSV
ncbi:MAG: hypothetical protein JW895_11455 [Thermoleophilaceae bacterium]|nr:hypothetical protein [Thermoleophilaceae bacterium]